MPDEYIKTERRLSAKWWMELSRKLNLASLEYPTLTAFVLARDLSRSLSGVAKIEAAVLKTKVEALMKAWDGK